MTKVFMFNPYTGTPRHPSDIASDPEGLLILEPGAPVQPTAPPQQEPIGYLSKKHVVALRGDLTKAILSAKPDSISGVVWDVPLYLHPPAQRSNLCEEDVCHYYGKPRASSCSCCK